MRIAESVCGSSPSVFIRLKVSRQEMPASTRILVQALATTAQFPRLPLASIETHTPMTAAYAPALWIGSNFLVSRYLRALHVATAASAVQARAKPRRHQGALSPLRRPPVRAERGS